MGSFFSREDREDRVVVRWCALAARGNYHHPVFCALFTRASVKEVAVLIERGPECVKRAAARGEDCAQKFYGFADLLMLGADFETRKSRIGFGLALGIAAKANDVDMVRYLLSQGAYADSDDEFRHIPCMPSCPLMKAIGVQNETIVRLILDAGVYPLPGALFYAIELQNETIVRLLLDRGACVHADMKIWAQTPLQCAIMERKGNFQAARMLLDRGADVNAYSKSFGTALNMAVESKKYATRRAMFVDTLLRFGANTELRNPRSGMTPLIFVAYLGDLATARVLLAARADVAARDIWGKTALIRASDKGWCNIVDLLVNCPGGAETVNMADNSGKTALSAALSEFHLSDDDDNNNEAIDFEKTRAILLSNGATSN